MQALVTHYPRRQAVVCLGEKMQDNLPGNLNKHLVNSRITLMNTIKFFALGSLCLIAIKFISLAVASMNGTYDPSQIQGMIPFVFVFMASASVWLLVFIFNAIFSKNKK